MKIGEETLKKKKKKYHLYSKAEMPTQVYDWLNTEHFLGLTNLSLKDIMS